MKAIKSICVTIALSLLLSLSAVGQEFVDPFPEKENLQFGPEKGRQMYTELYKASRIVPPKVMKEIYNIEVPPGYLALSNVRGDRLSYDTSLPKDSHYVVLLPVDHISRTDYCSTRAIDGTDLARHAAFRHNFSKDVLVFAQVVPKGERNYTAKPVKKVRRIVTHTVPLVPTPEDLMSEENASKSKLKYNDRTLGVEVIYPIAAKFTDRNPITKVALLEEKYFSDPGKYVPLEISQRESAQILVEWIREAKNVKYDRPYNLFHTNCYSDACGLLKKLFDAKRTKSIFEQCRYTLAGLPLGTSAEMLRLKTLGLVGPKAQWRPIGAD